MRTIRRGFSAYSVADVLDNGKFGVFYEANYTDAMRLATFDEEWLNYVCAPMQAESFTARSGSTLDVPVTITNQEDEALSGTIAVGTSTQFSATAKSVTNAAGASTTINLPVTVASTALGNQSLQPQFTSSTGKTSQVSVSAQITGEETAGLNILGQRTDTSRDLAVDPSVVGEKVPYSFRVNSIGNIAQWVAPTAGNFSPFAASPIGQPSPAGNCRYSNLPAGAGYTCATPRHEVTSNELANGFFIPQTHWTSGRVGDNAIVDEYTITGQEVDLVDRQPSFTVEASQQVAAEPALNSSAKAGDWISYEVTVTNTGNVRLSDLEGSGFSIQELDAGESKSATITRLRTGADASSRGAQEKSKIATARNGDIKIQAEISQSIAP